LLDKGRKMNLFRKRQENVQGYYITQDSLCICGNVNDLMDILGFSFGSEE
jgi:hypothetical protein